MNADDPQSRRNFFKRGLNKVAKVSIEAVEAKVEQKARHWIRPPFSTPELDFLLKCTRCDACIESCPHEVIFPLPSRRGIEVAGTPALDLVNKGCHLCHDWPCVNACEVGALSFNVLNSSSMNSKDEEEKTSLEHQIDLQTEGQTQGLMPAAQDCPPMAAIHITQTDCLPWQGPECGACKGSCPIPDTLIWSMEKPEIVSGNCIGCGLCREACIVKPNAIVISTLPLNETEVEKG